MNRAVVMYSSGIGSWAAARRAKKSRAYDEITLLFADTNVEDEDNYRFLAESAEDLGLPLVTIDNDGRTIWDVFRKRRFIGNSRIDPCSEQLKRKPMRAWLKANRDPANTVAVIGFGWHEGSRVKRAEPFWSPWQVDAPMTREPYVNRTGIINQLRAIGIEPPRLYEVASGTLEHANCGGLCVKAGQAQFRTAVFDPFLRPLYMKWEAEEEQLRSELGDVAILRERSGPRKDQPLTLRAFRERLEWQPSLFDPLDVGSCSCFTPGLEAVA